MTENRIACCGKLNALLCDVRQERFNLELALEIAPRNSRYSNTLVNLMQREEFLLREGKECKELSNEVENALNHETKAFFTKMSISNKKRWQFLLHKIQKDTEVLVDEVRDKCANDFTVDDHIFDEDIAAESGIKSARSSKDASERRNKFHAGSNDVTPLDIEIESLRLEEDYNKNWLDIESFHIQEAFKSQKERIDTEWSTHIDRLNSQYDAKCKEVIGQKDKDDTRNTRSGQNMDGRWQHPEKQKTLIHTAPVFSPTADRKIPVGSGVRAVRTKGNGASSKQQAELDNLRRQHSQMMDSLLAQKGNAVRWMRHQETRLRAQNEGIHTSRIPIANILAMERSLLKHFRTLYIKEEKNA